MPTFTLHLLATWADAIPDIAVFIVIMLFPFAIFQPVTGTIQIAAIIFVLIWAYKRWNRKRKHDGLDIWMLMAWMAGGYIVAVTITNLLSVVVGEWIDWP